MHHLSTTKKLFGAIAVLIAVSFLGVWLNTFAAFTEQVNYQGKLTNTSGVAVADGDYNMRFKIYTASSGGSPLWTETRTGTDQVEVKNGLFSVMLGSVNPISGVDFDQTLYLGVEIGGTGGTPSWDGEMTPRKILGAVPAAFQADFLDGLDSTQFVRSDTPDTMQASSGSTLLSLQQDGAGDIFNVSDSSSEVFTIIDGGYVGVGVSSPSYAVDVSGVVNASGGFRTNSETVTDFTGAGLALNSGALFVDINGQTADATPEGGNDYVMTYDASAGGLKKVLLSNLPSDADTLTLAEIGTNSTATSESLYTMTSGVPVEFETSANSPLLYLDETNGRVGVGTGSPTAKLNVQSDTTFNLSASNSGQDTLFLADTSAGASGGVGTMSGSIMFSNPYNSLRRAAGIAGVQTDSDADVMGLAFYTHPSSDGSLDIAEQVRIAGDGNVGIGTTSPSYKLDVDGDINLPEANALKFGGTDIVRANLTTDSIAVGNTTADITTASEVVYIGGNAGISVSGGNSVAVGGYAGRNSGDNFLSLGYLSGAYSGSNYVALGNRAGYSAGTRFMAQGYQAGRGAGDRFTAIGYESTNTNTLSSPTGINDSIALGYQSDPRFDGHFMVKQANLNSDPLIQGDLTSGKVGIGLSTATAASDIPELLSVNGILALGESSSPSATTGYGKLYPKTDNNLYYTDEAGTEYQLTGSGVTNPTLANIATNSTSTSESLYTMTSGVPVEFETSANSPLLYLDETNGRVGVGTDSPSRALEVNGNIKFSHVSDNSIEFGGSNTRIRGGSNNPIRFYTVDGDEDMVIDDGNVGIGITPGRKLDVGGGVAGSSLISRVYHTDNTDSGSDSIMNIVSGGASGGNAYFRSTINGVLDWSFGADNSDSDKFKISQSSNLGTNDYLTIDTSGNVGIGTDSPSSLLETSGGDVNLSDTLFVDESTNRVGIGLTNPNRELTVNGKVEVRDSNAPGFAINPVSGTQRVIFHTFGTGGYDELWFAPDTSVGSSPTPLMVMKDNNVGIGTTTPNEALTVSGILSLAESSSPSATTGYGKLYPKTDNNLYYTDEAGTEYQLTGSGVTNPTLANIATNSTSTSESLYTMTSGVPVEFETSANSPLLYLDETNGRVGVGTGSPSAKLHTMSTTEQFRLGYDGSNYTSFTVDSSGDLTISPTGTAVKFGTGGPQMYPYSSSADLSGANLTFSTDGSGTWSSQGRYRFVTNGANTLTSSGSVFMHLLDEFAPTSGTAKHVALEISSTINQTGGANGITRGVYIDPTLTAAADYRALEIANNSGFGVYQSGASATNYFNGNIGIGTTSPNELLTVEGVASLVETTAPTATTGYGKFFVKSADSLPYFLDSSGTEYDLTHSDEGYITSAGAGDDVSIDSSSVTDPDFVSTGDIDFVNSTNTITANINTGAVGDNEIDYSAVTLNDFTNDAGFFDNAGTGLSASGTTINLAAALNDLTDVSAGAPTNGEVLTYNGSNWVPSTDSGLTNAYTTMTDGTTSATASGSDTFKYRSANSLLTLSVTDNGATHGDNILFTVDNDLSNYDNSTSGFITDPNDSVSGSELDGVFSTNGLLKRTGANTYTTITDNSSNWDTAYSWGDHSTQGYLTGNETITLSGDVTGSGATSITTTIASDAVEESMLDATNTATDNYILSYDQTSGGFTWVQDDTGSTLTQEQVQDFAWGSPTLSGTQTLITVTYDDANDNVDFVVDDDLSNYDNTTSGFITDPNDSVSGSELDGVFSTNGILKRTSANTYTTITDNSSNWDTAYSWGDHSTQGYFDTAGTGLSSTGSTVSLNAALDDLTDVSASSPTSGEVLTYDGSNWVSQAGGSSTTTLANVSTNSTNTAQSLYTMSAGVPVEFETAANSPLLYLDETNGRVGIGDDTPGSKLEVVGDTAILGDIIMGDPNAPFTTGGIKNSSGALMIRFTTASQPIDVYQQLTFQQNNIFSRDGTGGSDLSVESSGKVNLGLGGKDVSLSGGALYLDGSNGNVGIGTDSPSYTLSVADATNEFGFSRDSTNTRSELIVPNQSNEEFRVKYGNWSGSSFSLYSGGGFSDNWFHVEKNGNSYFNTDSNVGIGTNSPSSNLDVVGSLQFATGNEVNNYVLTSDASGNADWEDVNTLVSGTNETLANIATNSTATSESLYTMTSGVPVEFETSANSPLLYLDETNGRVGVGTDSPDELLHVVDATPTMKFESSANGRIMKFIPSGGNLEVEGVSLNINEFNSNNIAMARGGGNVLVGTGTAAGRLTVQADGGASNSGITLVNSSGTSLVEIPDISTDEGAIRLYNSGTEKIRLRAGSSDSFINPGGNLGIGTTSPSYKLDVDGDINLPEANALKFGGTDIVRVNTTTNSIAAGDTTADITKTNVAVMGAFAAQGATGVSFTVQGRDAGLNAGGGGGIAGRFAAQGFRAGHSSGNAFVAQGYNAGYSSGNAFVAQGYNAGRDSGGQFTAVGGYIDGSGNGGTGAGAGNRFTAIGTMSTDTVNLNSPAGIDDSIALGYQSDPRFDGHFMVKQANLNADPLIQGDLTSGKVGIGLSTATAASDIPELLSVNGILALGESSSPSATTGYGKLYPKTDNNLYYTDEAGTEYQLTGSGVTNPTLADISTNSTATSESLYTMTSGVPVEFETSANSPLLYLDETNGRVGVGADSPAEALHVGNGNIRADGVNAGVIVNGGTPAALIAGNSKSSFLFDNAGSFSIQARDSAEVIDGTPSSADSVLDILSNGNVGIGTSSPSALIEGEKTAVAGREELLKLTVSDDANTRFDVFNATVAGGDFVPTFQGHKEDSGNPSLIFSGQTDSANDTGSTPLLSFLGRATDGDPINGTYSDVSTRPIVEFKNRATSLLLIDSSGNVGIGTTSPNERLTVEGVASLVETTAPSATTGYGKFFVKSADSLPYFLDSSGTEYDLTHSDEGYITSAGAGDDVSIDSSSVTDPDFVSSGDIDFVNSTNTITANINTGAVGDDEVDYTAVTLNDFTNDAGFFDNAGTGLSASGTTINLAAALNDLTDVSAASPTNGEVLTYNGSNWVPSTDSGLTNAYTTMTDGTTSATASGSDTFKYRSANSLLSLSVTDDDPTHGDNILYTVDNDLSNYDNTTSGFITDPNDSVSGSELDGVFSTTGLLKRTGANTYTTITDNSSNWDTAYSWGDHSTQGYFDTAGTGLSSTGSTVNLTDTTVSAGSYTNADITVDAQGRITAASDGSSGASTLADLSDTTVNTPASGNLLIYDGTDSWDNQALSGDATINASGALSLATGSVSDNEIDYTAVTLNDFTNDAGFFDNAGTGLSASGTTINLAAALNDLTDVSAASPTNGEVLEYDGSKWVPGTDENTTYTAGTGLTLSGTTFSNDFGTEIDIGEIASGSLSGNDSTLVTGTAGNTGECAQWDSNGDLVTASEGCGSAASVNNQTYTGSFIITGSGTQTISGLPFEPNMVEFRAQAPVDAKNDEGAGPSNGNEENNYAGGMMGFARDDSGTTVQEVIHAGGSGNSINAIRHYASDSHAIGVSYGNNNGSEVAQVTAQLSSWNANGFSINVDSYSSMGNLSGLVVHYTAYRSEDISNDATDVSDGGSLVVSSVGDINFGSNLSVTDDGDGTVTVNSSSSGITSLNGETGSTQTFSKTDDTNVTLSITSSANDHDFTMGWSGDLALGRGGTGASLTDPNADRLLGWDDSANSSTWITPGTGLSVDASANLNVSGLTTSEFASSNISQWTNNAGYDDVSVDGTSTTDPDFVSSGDIDFVNSTNTVTANINTGAVGDNEIDYTAVTLNDFNNDVGFITDPNDSVSGSELDGVFSTNGLLKRTSANTYTTITDNSSNWDTAYSWGDHSTQGYLTGNETITLSGDVTGSGSTSITTTIANDAVEESMLDATNTATDNYILSYDQTSGGFTWVQDQTGSGGITSLNGETGSTQTFSKTDDTNVTLSITSSTNDHNFAMGWSGDLALGRGGTGASLTDPNADRLLGWDDSAGTSAWITPGTGLSVDASGNLNVSDITTTEIKDATILEEDLNTTNTPTDNYILSYDSTSTGFTWVQDQTGSGGITSLNGETGSTQTFSSIDDTNVQLEIASTSNDHEFTMGWTGDLSLARGGTAASLSDPNDDRIFFWDDSQTSTNWLDIGSGLDLTNTTLSATGGGADSMADVATNSATQAEHEFSIDTDRTLIFESGQQSNALTVTDRGGVGIGLISSGEFEVGTSSTFNPNNSSNAHVNILDDAGTTFFNADVDTGQVFIGQAQDTILQPHLLVRGGAAFNGNNYEEGDFSIDGGSHDDIFFVDMTDDTFTVDNSQHYTGGPNLFTIQTSQEIPPPPDPGVFNTALNIDHGKEYTAANNNIRSNKAGIRINSTGSFTEGTSINYGLYIDEPTGGDENYSIYLAGTGQDRIIDTATGAYLSNSGVWQGGSSRDIKTNFESVNERGILRKINSLTIEEWTYIINEENGDGDIRHIGPYAGEFYDTFGIGENPETISSMDAAGVALVGIQALSQELDSLEARVSALEAHGFSAGSAWDGTKELARAIFGRVEADTVATDAFEMTDQATGEIYCVTLENGSFVHEEGGCDETDTAEEDTTSSDTPSDTTEESNEVDETASSEGETSETEEDPSSSEESQAGETDESSTTEEETTADEEQDDAVEHDESPDETNEEEQPAGDESDAQETEPESSEEEGTSESSTEEEEEVTEEENTDSSEEGTTTENDTDEQTEQANEETASAE